MCTQVSTRLKSPRAFVKLFPPPVGTLCKPHVLLFPPPVGTLCKPHSILFPPPVAMAKNHTLQQKCRVIPYFVAVRAMHDISTNHPVRHALPRGHTTVPPRTVIMLLYNACGRREQCQVLRHPGELIAHIYAQNQYYAYFFPPPVGILQNSTFVKKTFIVRTHIYIYIYIFILKCSWFGAVCLCTTTW